jgi:hypothetical protein
MIMKFMMMGLEPRGEWERLEADEMNRRVRQHQQKLDDLAMARAQSGPPGLIFASVGLSEERDVVTVKCERGRHACVDGPFPETKEVIGGFDIVEFASHQEAIEWTTAMQRHPSHVAEIRPIADFWWISGMVDRVRLLNFERWSPASGSTPTERAAAAEVFMLTSVEDERVVLSRPESERKRIAPEQQLVGAAYVRQRSLVDHQPGMWLGARLCPSAEACTVRWAGAGPVVSDGPFTQTKDVISGFNLVACASREEAISWAQRLASRDGDVIEVRPVRGCWWVYHE